MAAFNRAGDAVDQAEEARLLKQACAGECEAFGRLVVEYWPGIFRWLLACSAEPAVAEDLTQEVFLKAWKKLREGEVICQHFRAWLYRIAANALTDWRRRLRLERRHVRQNGRALPEREPSADLAGREVRQRLWQAVMQLPLSYRMPLLLRAQEQLSFREIADHLGITEETARWRVFRARSLLLQQLGSLLDWELPTPRKLAGEAPAKGRPLSNSGSDNA